MATLNGGGEMLLLGCHFAFSPRAGHITGMNLRIDGEAWPGL